MIRRHCQHPLHLAACYALVGGVTLALLSCDAHAGGVCRVVAKQVVAAPVYAQQVVATPVYYQVGASLQQEAVATQAFRQSSEYLELERLRGFREAVMAMSVQRGVAQAVDSDTANELQPPAAPDAAGPPQSPAVKYPTLLARCATCHAGDEPKGGVWLDGSVPLAGPDAAVKRDAIVRVITQGTMPKNGTLTPEEFGALLGELYQDE